MSQPKWKVAGPYVVCIKVGKARGDIDNYIKPLIDALVAWEYMPDDKHMAGVLIMWAGVVGVQVYVEPLTAAE